MADGIRAEEVRRALHEAVERAVEKAGEHILDVSNAHVPLESGDLEKSGRVTADGRKAAISYDGERGGVVAVVQHEDMSLQHAAGRTSKFLENAMNSEKSTALRIVADELRPLFKP